MKALERAIKEDEIKSASPSDSGRNSPAVAGSSNGDRKTAAERRFEEIQRKRVRTLTIHVASRLSDGFTL